MTEFKCVARLTTHSPRTWHATMAEQLLYSRGCHEHLWHWAPGSLVPDRYGRVICAAELRIRDEIIGGIRKCWVPEGPFETQKETPAKKLKGGELTCQGPSPRPAIPHR